MGEAITVETVRVELPRSGIAEALRSSLERHGLRAAIVDDGDTCALDVRFATDERERLLAEVTHAVEGWLGEHATPLVVQRAHDGCVVRPPGD